jgi:adenine-specific DNA-methyltransferase
MRSLGYEARNLPGRGSDRLIRQNAPVHDQSEKHEAAVGAIDTPVLRKARGAFFTPPELCRYIAEWAVRDGRDDVLEPSCGEAAFLMAAAERQRSLARGASSGEGLLRGVELHEASAQAAEKILSNGGHEVQIAVGDFFGVDPTPGFDAVIGNPPYVRYQDFSGSARTRSREAALRAGVSLTKLASSWAAFTVHSALFLKQGGRLGLVLPAELLSVNYAAEVRRFLLQRFESVRLVLFNERVFPGVLEEVVLLLADGFQFGPTDHFDLYEANNLDDLASVTSGRSWRPASPEAKWTASLLGADASLTYSAVTSPDAFECLQDWGETTLGMVTGSNGYFALTNERARELGLPPRELLPLSPPGSRHLRNLSLDTASWRHLGAMGKATHLFRPAAAPSAAARRYIAAGEQAGIHEAYKCRVRTPWWRVPFVPPADLLVTCMNADTPRLCSNDARLLHLNSVHGLYLRDERRAVGAAVLSVASLNSITLLGAELVGRSYGGGMLKLEPREADHLPMPAFSLVADRSSELAAARPAVADSLHRGDLAGAVAQVDAILLRQGLGMTERELGVLVAGRETLASRRRARGGSPAGLT